MLLVKWIVYVQVSHVIIPLWVMRVQNHGLKWELRSNSLSNIKQVKHFFNRLVSLLTHTSKEKVRMDSVERCKNNTKSKRLDKR